MTQEEMLKRLEQSSRDDLSSMVMSGLRATLKNHPETLSRRDEFAKTAMGGLLSNTEIGVKDTEIIARWSVEQADALIAELDKEVE